MLSRFTFLIFILTFEGLRVLDTCNENNRYERGLKIFRNQYYKYCTDSQSTIPPKPFPLNAILDLTDEKSKSNTTMIVKEHQDSVPVVKANLLDSEIYEEKVVVRHHDLLNNIYLNYVYKKII